MNKRSIMFLGLWLLLSVAAFSQTAEVHFSYDANGNRTSRTLTVRKVEDNGIPVDTPESQGFADVIAATFGRATLSIFPNPTHDKLTVVLEGVDDETIASLITVAGTVIRQCRLVEGSHDFNLADLPPGVYLLHLSAPSMSQTWKIIKN